MKRKQNSKIDGSKVEEAVKNCVNNITKTQAMIRALYHVRYYINNKCEDKYRFLPPLFDNQKVDEAFSVIFNVLFHQLIYDWNQLGWLIPASNEAMRLARKRLKTWFEREDTDIMSWIGNRGQYYTDDAKEFRKEVMKIFEISDGD